MSIHPANTAFQIVSSLYALALEGQCSRSDLNYMLPHIQRLPRSDPVRRTFDAAVILTLTAEVVSTAGRL